MGNPKRLLVTGGAGFIGHESVLRAQAAGFTVASLDLNPQPEPAPGISFYGIDIRESVAVRKVFRDFQPTHVLHMASDIDISIRRLEDFKTTIDGTRHVLDAALACPDLVRFVHVSTQFVVKPGVEPVSETFFDPYTLYGVAKVQSERDVRASGVPFLIARPTIIWGPRHPSFGRQIWRYIANRAYLHPSGPNPIMRCFGYVENVAFQLIAMLNAELEEGGAGQRQVFYLGDATINYDDWVDAFAIPLTGKKARRIPVSLLRLMAGVGSLAKTIGIPSPIDQGRFFRMTTSSIVDLDPILRLCGPSPVPFEQGVARTLDWLVATDPSIYRHVASQSGGVPTPGDYARRDVASGE